MFLFEHYDCPFSCPCFWPCYCWHHCQMMTFINPKKEKFYDWDEIEKYSKTGDFYTITTQGLWMFGPVCGLCQKRPSIWSHVGIIYKKHDNYKQDLCQEYVDIIEANPTQIMFAFEAIDVGFTLTPMRPMARRLTHRIFPGFITLLPLKDKYRDRIKIEDIYQAANDLSEGIYDFNPCWGAITTIDVWPCGCECSSCCNFKDGSTRLDDKSNYGVCTTWCSRMMLKAGYFESYPDDTRFEKRLKQEFVDNPPEEMQANDLMAQEYLYNMDLQMIWAGQTSVIQDDEVYDYSFKDSIIIGDDTEELDLVLSNSEKSE